MDSGDDKVKDDQAMTDEGQSRDGKDERVLTFTERYVKEVFADDIINQHR